MACSLYMIAVVIFNLFGVSSGQLEVSKDDNIEPFSLLCRIYNVAKNPPINYVDLEEPFEIVREIDALNSSLVEPKLVDETEMGNSVGAQIPHAITREAALAQLSLKQITQSAHKILEEIEKLKVSENIEKVKAEFNKVIVGERGNESELDQGALNGVSDRAVACGKPGDGVKGSSAGKNLVVDFFCLCARRADDDGVNQVCGFYVGVKNSKIGWNNSDLMGSSTMWASIKGGCGKYMHQHPKSTAEARHILDQFLKHLKAGGVYRQIDCESDCKKGDNAKIKDSDRKEGMLGAGVTVNGASDFTCDGKKGGWKKVETSQQGKVNPGGVCVYYGQESEWEGNIEWLKQFKTSLNAADALNNKTATIQLNVEKLNMLLHRAEEIYETAKVITEIKNPIRLASVFPNASGNLTAYNTTRIRSFSYISHPCFMLLCVLLL